MDGMSGALTLDQYIERLETLRNAYGGRCPVVAGGGDYPEPAAGPRYVTQNRATAYEPAGSVVLR